MKVILNELDLDSQWTLIPMMEDHPGGGGGDQLKSSDLGHKLTHALKEMRRRFGNDNGPVIFLGMDSPELPLDEIASALEQGHQALLCPAGDGGYGMLSVPAQVPAECVFLPLSPTIVEGSWTVSRWSTSLTAVAQLKALTDVHVSVRLGRLMHDMDEQKDIDALCQRLQESPERPVATEAETRTSPTGNSNTEQPRPMPGDCLMKTSRRGGIQQTAPCHYTRQSLKRLGQLKE